MDRASCCCAAQGFPTDQPTSPPLLAPAAVQVAALVLQHLLAAAAAPDSTFEVAAVVTQPPRPTGRGNRQVPQPSPVQEAAAAAGLPADRILAPEKPGDPAFLAALRQLAPDLCITAAYGNYLPSSFLAVPPHGTLNIHPSLLPAYRGAAPVQRSLQDGVPISGVTVLYTVKAMDAGPILAQQKLPVGGCGWLGRQGRVRAVPAVVDHQGKCCSLTLPSPCSPSPFGTLPPTTMPCPAAAGGPRHPGARAAAAPV